jgi:EspA/EspE family
VGVLDGFESTWSNARSTFGQGAPQEGAQFDNSGQLRQMQSSVESAKPDARWTGSASDSYASSNDKQGRVLGQMADLDQRLRTEIDRSAQVVSTGRQNLDAVRQWVYDAAATVPPGQNRDRMLYPIVSRGAGDIAEILQRTNADSNAIAGRLGGIKGEYQMLGDDLKQGTGDEADRIVGEEEEVKKRARDDVKAALDGDKGAINRVQNVLNTITPQHQAGQPKLNPEQQAYLSQMQSQQKLRSVEQLEEAANKGARGIMSDSWQLMSNPKIEFPKTESVDGALQSSEMVSGGFNQLPDSVQSTINSPGIQNSENLQKVVDIVKGGNADGYFQQNTDLDRGLMHKVADMMESPEWRSDDPPLDLPGNWPLEDAPRPPHAALEKWPRTSSVSSATTIRLCTMRSPGKSSLATSSATSSRSTANTSCTTSHTRRGTTVAPLRARCSTGWTTRLTGRRRRSPGRLRTQ